MYMFVIFLTLAIQISALSLFRRGPTKNNHTYAQIKVVQEATFKDCLKKIDPVTFAPMSYNCSTFTEDIENSKVPAEAPAVFTAECQESVIKCLENFVNRVFPFSVSENGNEVGKEVQTNPGRGLFYSAYASTFERNDFEHSLGLDGIEDFYQEPLDYLEDGSIYDHTLSSGIGTATDPSVDMSDSDSLSTSDITDEDRISSLAHLRVLYNHLFGDEEPNSFESCISDFENSD